MPRKRSRDEVLGTLLRASSYLLPYKLQLAGVFLLIIVVTVCSLSFPASPAKSSTSPPSPTAGPTSSPSRRLRLILMVRSVAQISRNFLIQQNGMRVTCDLRIAIFSHLQKLSLKFYEERQTGRIVARVLEDSSAIHNLVTGASVTLFSDLITAVGVFVWLFPQLETRPRLRLPHPSLHHQLPLSPPPHAHGKPPPSPQLARVVGFLNERIANNRVVRAFATEEEEENTFRYGIQADYVNCNRVVWRNTLLLSFAEFLAGPGQLIAIGFGAWLICRHSPGFTTGGLFAFLGYLTMLYTPIVNVVASNAVIQKGVTAMEKIFAVLDTKPHIPENDTLPEFPPMHGNVEFRDVSFGYRIGQTTLDHVNFTVQPGEMIALVGPSGAGKSTIITLLSRFYDPTAGQVLIDDQPIADFNVQSVRRQIGIVMQDNILFSGTIAENIRYGRPDATQEEIIAAARAANAHDFIVDSGTATTPASASAASPSPAASASASPSPASCSRTPASSSSTRPPPRSIPTPSASSRTPPKSSCGTAPPSSSPTASPPSSTPTASSSWTRAASSPPDATPSSSPSPASTATSTSSSSPSAPSSAFW